MRSVTILLALVTAGCSPTVEVPPGGSITSEGGTGGDLPAPAVQRPPSPYPFTKLALRGTADNASRVLVEGAGNPASGSVQPIDDSFCVVVDLAAAPAHYTLEVKSQSADGRLSAAARVEVDRDNNASAPKDAKLCDGSPAN